MELLLDVLVDSLVDSIKLVPFLFVTYLAMEALENFASQKVISAVQKSGSWAPVVGSVLGCLPQCGFSAAAATLWSGRVITLGTLVAVFLSTGDELLPVFIANGAPISQLLSILAIKAVIGLALGLLVDFVIRRTRGRNQVEIDHVHDLCVRDRCGCEWEGEGDGDGLGISGAASGCDDAADADRGGCDRGDVGLDHGKEDHGHEGHGHEGHEHGGHDHGHQHDHQHRSASEAWLSAFKCALVHTVRVTLFILLITFFLGLLVETVGSDAIAAFMGGNQVLSVFASGLVGLIPNCAASVIATEFFLEGTIAFPALLSASLVSAGVGLLVLFRTNRDVRQNLAVVGMLYGFGVCFGLIALVCGIAV